MVPLAVLKLLLCSVAVIGISYACLGSGAFKRANKDWWGGLSKQKRAAFVAAIGATIAQSFL